MIRHRLYLVIGLLLVLFLLLFSSTVYVADGAGINKIPPYTTDGAGTRVKISGLSSVLNDTDQKVITEKSINDYIIKYVSNPALDYAVLDSSYKKSYDVLNNTEQHVFVMVSGNNQVMKVSVSGAKNLWVKVLISGIGSNTAYEYTKNLRPSPSFQGN